MTTEIFAMLHASLTTKVLSHHVCSWFDGKEQVRWPDQRILCLEKGIFTESIKP